MTWTNEQRDLWWYHNLKIADKLSVLQSALYNYDRRNAFWGGSSLLGQVSGIVK